MRWVLLVLVLLLVNCDTREKQQHNIKLKYNHVERGESRVRVGFKDAPVSHHIKVEPNITEAWLDSNMSATVKVPVGVLMRVDYKNYTLKYPNIHYEYRSSNPLSVSNYSPNSITITILVSINSDYPIEKDETIDNTTTECTQDCTVDNTTIIDNVTYTDNATWSDNFTYNTRTTQEQKTKWENFWDNLSTSDNWSYIEVGSPTITTHFCDNQTTVSRIITQIQTDNMTNWNATCSNSTWVTGGCGQGIELKATTEPNRTGDCRCASISDNTTTIRPAILNKNWGGRGKSCSSSSQALQVILKRN